MTGRADEWARAAAPFLLTSAALVLLSLGVNYLAYRLQLADPGSEPVAALRWFDVSSERNIPTAWSALLLLGCSAAAAALSRGPARQGSRAGWYLISATCAYLALDESLELHERLGEVGAAVASDQLHFTWVVPGAALAALLGLVLLWQLRAHPVVLRRRLAAAAAGYLFGALAVETAGGQVLRAAGAGRSYVVVTAVEESLEMAGASLALAALLCHRRRKRRPT